MSRYLYHRRMERASTLRCVTPKCVETGRSKGPFTHRESECGRESDFTWKKKNYVHFQMKFASLDLKGCKRYFNVLLMSLSLGSYGTWGSFARSVRESNYHFSLVDD